MIKRIILSLLIIVGVGGSAVAGTQALLSDTATLGANTLNSGSVNLEISNSQSSNVPSGSSFDEVRTGFSGQIRPGQTKSYLFWLQNQATDVALSLSGQATNVVVANGVTKSQVTVSFTRVGNDGLDVGAPTASATLEQWEAGNLPFGFNIEAGAETRYKMDIALSESVTTTGSASFDFIFTGTQVNP